jgi:hypothetical protein
MEHTTLAVIMDTIRLFFSHADFMSGQDLDWHRIYMSFMLRGQWYCQFIEENLQIPLPRVHREPTAPAPDMWSESHTEGLKRRKKANLPKASGPTNIMGRFHLEVSQLQSGTLHNRPFFGLGVAMGSFGVSLPSSPGSCPLRLSIRQLSRDCIKPSVFWILDLDSGATEIRKRAPQQKTMIRASSIWLGLLAIAFLPLLAQTQESTGRIHGHVTNPTGASQSGGTVTLAAPGAGMQDDEGSFPVDNNGNYVGQASLGTYTVIYRTLEMTSDRKADKADNVEIVAGQDTLQDIDMSRREYVDALPADQRRPLEELKRHNSEAMKANDVIRGLHADLRIVTQDLKDADSASDAETKAAKYGEAEALMLRDTQAKPDASILWAQLGQAQLGLMKFREAESSFTKTLELESVSTRPNPQIQSLANTKLAQIHAGTSMVAGTNAAPLVPNQPAQGSPSPAPAQHQYEDLAPPPPPPAPAPTISMGQTKSQVTSAFREPQRKAAAGAKEIFFYTDLKMKVTFTKGKVSSID